MEEKNKDEIVETEAEVEQEVIDPNESKKDTFKKIKWGKLGYIIFFGILFILIIVCLIVLLVL